MKTVSSSFKGGAMTLARCWRIYDQRSHIHAFTDHDCDLTYLGISHQSVNGFQSTAIEAVLGFSASSQDLSGLLASPGLLEEDIVAGQYDGARIEIDLVNWQNTGDGLRLQTGVIGEITRVGAAFTAEIRSLSARLDEERGRLYRATCPAEFCDPQCGLDRNDSRLSFNSHVVATDGKQMIIIDHPVLTINLTGGSVRFQSGNCQGQISSISSYSMSERGLSLRLWVALPAVIAVHDQIIVNAGCDKYFQTCRDIYHNTVNFRGFPHMPGNDFIIAGIVDGSPGLDGGSFFR